jgi:hypothetical protein
VKKTSIKIKVYLAVILIFILVFTACGKEVIPSDENNLISTPPVDNISDYILIGEAESSNEFLQNESNNIKVYGKNKDDFGNYTETKFVYGDTEWISDEVKIFADKEMYREDTRQFNLSLYEDKDIISVIYYEMTASDEVKENILFFDQQSFTLIKPEDINISIQNQPSEEKVVVGGKSCNMSVIVKSKIDSEIFDKKMIIVKHEDIELCALKKDSDNNYYDIYVKAYKLGKTVMISDKKQFEYTDPVLKVLDVNGDGNDEIVINFFEKVSENEITQSVCFIDPGNEKEVTLLELGLESIVQTTHNVNEYTLVREGKTYKVNACHYTRKVNLNKDDYNSVPTDKIISKSSENPIELSVFNDPVSYITEGGKPTVFVLQYNNDVGLYYDWSMPKCYEEIDQYDHTVDMHLMDINDDGLNEIVITMFIGGGTESSEMELHIINSPDLSEIVTLTNHDIGLLLKDYVDSRIYVEGNEVKFEICINNDMDNMHTYSMNRNENMTYFSSFGYASVVNYVPDSDKNLLIGEMSAAIGVNQFIGHFEFEITLAENKAVFRNIQFIQGN